MVTSIDAKIIGQWLQSQASPHTRGCYRRDADRLIEKLRKPLHQIGLGDLQAFADYLAKAGLAPISQLRSIAAVRSLFGFCQRTGYLSSNPARELPLPSYERRLAERILAEEDIQRLLAAVTGLRNYVLLNLIYIAGLRISEACQLRWRNLRPRGDAGQITVYGKGGRTRAITLPESLWSGLVGLRGTAGAEAPVFLSRSGKPLDRGRVRIILRRAAERTGVAGSVSPHWLRHAHASHALDHGAPIHLVQATLGHSSVATTSAYLHARPGDSSARFLSAGRLSPQSSKLPLPFERRGVMDVIDTVSRGKESTYMTTFTIDTDNNISAFATPEEAAASTTTPSESFASQKALAGLAAGWPAERLVAIWNSLPGVKPVKGFKSAKTAAGRIWERIQGLGEAGKPVAEPAKPKPERKPKGGAQSAKGAPAKGKATKKTTAAKAAPKAERAAKALETAGPREGTKTAQVVAMLQRKGGATLAEITTKMGWQKHTVRGFMAGAMKKAGYAVESFKPDGGERTYRINAK